MDASVDEGFISVFEISYTSVLFPLYYNQNCKNISSWRPKIGMEGIKQEHASESIFKCSLHWSLLFVYLNFFIFNIYIYLNAEQKIPLFKVTLFELFPWRFSIWSWQSRTAFAAHMTVRTYIVWSGSGVKTLLTETSLNPLMDTESIRNCPMSVFFSGLTLVFIIFL